MSSFKKINGILYMDIESVVLDLEKMSVFPRS